MEEYFCEKRTNLLQQNNIKIVKQISRNQIIAINEVKIGQQPKTYLLKSYKFARQFGQTVKQQNLRILEFLLSFQTESMITYQGFILDTEKDELSVLFDGYQQSTITLFESIYLKQQNKNNKAYTEIQIISICTKLLEVLWFLHKNQLIHGNIHPNNIFMTGNVIKLGEINYNIAKASNHKKSRSELKEKYKSPQNQLKKNCTPADDIWALGCVLYEMATSEPYVKQLQDIQFLIHQHIAQKRLQEIPQIYSENFKNLLKMCLSFNPQHRAKTDELIQFLKKEESIITKRKQEKSNFSAKKKGKITKKKAVHFDENVKPESQPYEQKSIIQILMQDKKQCESQQMIEFQQQIQTQQCKPQRTLQIDNNFMKASPLKLADISSVINSSSPRNSQCLKPDIKSTFSPRETRNKKFLSSDFEKYLHNFKMEKNKLWNNEKKMNQNQVLFSKTIDMSKFIQKGVLQNSAKPKNHFTKLNQKPTFIVYNASAKIQQQKMNSGPISFTKRQSIISKEREPKNQNGKFIFTKKLHKQPPQMLFRTNLVKTLTN